MTENIVKLLIRVLLAVISLIALRKIIKLAILIQVHYVPAHNKLTIVLYIIQQIIALLLTVLHAPTRHGLREKLEAHYAILLTDKIV